MSVKTLTTKRYANSQSKETQNLSSRLPAKKKISSNENTALVILATASFFSSFCYGQLIQEITKGFFPTLYLSDTPFADVTAYSSLVICNAITISYVYGLTKRLVAVETSSDAQKLHRTLSYLALADLTKNALIGAIFVSYLAPLLQLSLTASLFERNVAQLKSTLLLTATLSMVAIASRYLCSKLVEKNS